MKICPLMSYRNKYVSDVECNGELCMFWNEFSDTCLLREILFHQLGAEPTIEQRIEKLEKDNRLLSVGFSPM